MKIFSAVQVCWRLAAPLDAGSTKNIALTTAVVNIKFSVNHLIVVHSLPKIICAPTLIAEKQLQTR